MASELSVQQQLRAQYEQLDTMQRSLVQVFAVLYQPTGREKAFRCWNAGIPRPQNGPRIGNIQQFNIQVKQLLQKGLLTQAPQEGARCAELLIDIAVRDAVKAGVFESIAAAIAVQFPVRTRGYGDGSRIFFFESEFLREFRIAFYRQDIAALNTLSKDFSASFRRPSLQLPLTMQAILHNPFDHDWFNSLPDRFQIYIFKTILTNSARQCLPATQEFELLEAIYDQATDKTELTLLYLEQLWLRGYLKEAHAILAEATPNITTTDSRWAELAAQQGAIAFLQGQTEAAIAFYKAGLKAVGKSQSAQANWFRSPATILYFFALFKQGSPAAHKAIQTYCILLQKQLGQGHWLAPSTSLLTAVLLNQQSRLTPDMEKAYVNYSTSRAGLVALLESYSLYWLNLKHLNAWFAPQLITLYRMASQADYSWIALATVELMARFQYKDIPEGIHQELAEALREDIGSQSLIDIIQRKEPWERSLGALVNLAEPSAANGSTASQPTFRLIWKLRFGDQDDWELTPFEQKRSARGGWTKGKAIALKRLYTPADRPDYLTPEDERICDTLKNEHASQRYYYYSKPSYTFGEAALVALAGHRHVFWADAEGVRVDIVKGEPELLVKQLTGDRLRIELLPQIPTDVQVLAFKETPTRLKVIKVTDDHRRITAILGAKHHLEVPAQAQDRVLQAIGSLSSLVTVQSDIGGGAAAEEVPSNATPHVHLLPAGEGLKVSILIHPFPEGGTYYKPGNGGETVIAEVNGQRLQTQRDLKAEKKRAKEVKTACAVLQQSKAKKGEWVIEEPSDCLELLLQLQALGDRVFVEWPEGEKFRVSKQFGLSDFKVSIRRQKDWFAASGEVQISEDRVLDIQQLMTLLEGSPGKFIQLSGGEFLALTEEFRQRLQALRRLSELNGKKELRVHGLGALALHEMTEDVEQIKVDKAWRDNLKRINTARTLEPQVPERLKVTLRDYQIAGFTWLVRLAEWGVGACLADDMGLGKTLQAIAVILHRCSDGPTLVIAPTSVGFNWVSEIERFAPSLQAKVFGSGDRQKMLDALGPQDLLVCSYGLLQQAEAAKMLAQINWQTIVLDEAQAIKNSATKRSQAAMALQGNFKIITTGTPIENHLGELWNLFRFINPGLLGSLESFNERFAHPIERDQDEFAREALRRLIQPFILRRTKDQVLKELPSRTEITLQIELSPQEMAFYETLRREAVEKLTASDVEAGTKHLQVLAEIMRLRRACCNPQLVRPELDLASTKLQQFSEVLAELLDNGHKALVFSQFVDHLAILRKHLDKQQIAYQYLDGSTPAKQRKTRVEAFQNGEGDVFLISLKAGGTGLNLTAADYVIHMDPWWNPAVEDQASDRAHRIGQKRPVTIYRLVAKGTIEAKIVALHKTKRDLADSLLTGSDVSSRISTDELLALIRG